MKLSGGCREYMWRFLGCNLEGAWRLFGVSSKVVCREAVQRV